MVAGNDNPQAAETGLKKKHNKTETTFVSADTALAASCTLTWCLGSPGGQDSPGLGAPARQNDLRRDPGLLWENSHCGVAAATLW